VTDSWTSANLDNHEPGDWWKNINHPASRDEVADHVVVFYCPWERYEKEGKAQHGPNLTASFKDALGASRGRVRRGLKVYLKMRVSFDNAALQTQNYTKETDHEGIAQWHNSFTVLIDEAARLGVFVDTAPGHWKERGSLRNSRHFLCKATFERIITQVRHLSCAEPCC
jgi:hypothetical protein